MEMFKKIIAIYLCLAFFIPFVNISLADVGNVFDVTFDHHPYGSVYTKAAAESDFKAEVASYTADKRINVDEDGNLSFYMPHCGGSFGGINTTGGQILTNIPSKNEYTLSYRVKFDGNGEDYDFNSGGKLPGLGGGGNYTGGRGEEAKTGDGFSVRVNFTENASGQGGQPRLYIYAYYQDMPGDYGSGWGAYIDGISSDTWHNVNLYIKLNTGSNADGILKLYLDGAEKFSKSDIRFRNNGCFIDKMHLTSFHGGNTEEYDPDHDQFIKFSNIRLDEGLYTGDLKSAVPAVKHTLFSYDFEKKGDGTDYTANDNVEHAGNLLDLSASKWGYAIANVKNGTTAEHSSTIKEDSGNMLGRLYGMNNTGSYNIYPDFRKPVVFEDEPIYISFRMKKPVTDAHYPILSFHEAQASSNTLPASPPTSYYNWSSPVNILQFANGNLVVPASGNAPLGAYGNEWVDVTIKFNPNYTNQAAGTVVTGTASYIINGVTREENLSVSYNTNLLHDVTVSGESKKAAIMRFLLFVGHSKNPNSSEVLIDDFDISKYDVREIGGEPEEPDSVYHSDTLVFSDNFEGRTADAALPGAQNANDVSDNAWSHVNASGALYGTTVLTENGGKIAQPFWNSTGTGEVGIGMRKAVDLRDSDTIVKARVRVPTPSGTEKYSALISMDQIRGNWLYTGYSAGKYKKFVEFTSDAKIKIGPSQTESGAFELDQWQDVELLIHQDGSTQSSMVLSVYINGVKKGGDVTIDCTDLPFMQTGASSPWGDFNILRFDVLRPSGIETPGRVYYDDIRITKTQGFYMDMENKAEANINELNIFFNHIASIASLNVSDITINPLDGAANPSIASVTPKTDGYGFSVTFSPNLEPGKGYELILDNAIKDIAGKSIGNKIIFTTTGGAPDVSCEYKDDFMIIDDDFNSYSATVPTSGANALASGVWSLIPGDGSTYGVSIENDGGNKFIRTYFKNPSINAAGSMRKSVDLRQNNFIIGAKVRVPKDTDGNVTSFARITLDNHRNSYRYTGNSGVQIDLVEFAANGQILGGAGKIAIGTYQADTWYDVELYFKQKGLGDNSGILSIYVNGQRLGSDISISFDNNPFYKEANSGGANPTDAPFLAVRFDGWILAGKTSEVHYDDAKIYKSEGIFMDVLDKENTKLKEIDIKFNHRVDLSSLTNEKFRISATEGVWETTVEQVIPNTSGDGATLILDEALEPNKEYLVVANETVVDVFGESLKTGMTFTTRDRTLETAEIVLKKEGVQTNKISKGAFTVSVYISNELYPSIDAQLILVLLNDGIVQKVLTKKRTYGYEEFGDLSKEITIDEGLPVDKLNLKAYLVDSIITMQEYFSESVNWEGELDE